MAARILLVENAARGAEEGVNVRTERQSCTAGRLRATSEVRGAADAMMGVLVAMWC